MTFTDKLKELVGKATKGPWEHHVSSRLDNVGGRDCAIVPKGTKHILAETFEVVSDGVRYPNEANAALIVHLVNHAEDIVALVEAAQAQLDYMDMCNDKGDLERNLRAALSRLEAKP